MPLYPTASLGDRIRASDAAREKLNQDPRIKKLYEGFVEKRFTPAQGRRNSDLVAMVTFLFRAVGSETLMILVGAFHDLNQEAFSDSREVHMAEAAAHLRACSISWNQELSIEERTALQGLPERYVEAYRISRDLSVHQAETSHAGQFFLSYKELANRIGTPQKEAQKILGAFESQGWLKILEKGTQHKLGARGKATLYRWVLPVIASLILIFSFHYLFYSNLIRQPLSSVIATLGGSKSFK